MKQRSEHHLPVRRSGGVDFLRIPDENVVDLRPSVAGEEAKSKTRSAPSKRRIAGPGKQTVKFFLLALLVALPVAGVSVWQHLSALQGKVLGASTDAYASLRSAGGAMANVDATLAAQRFSQAAESFRQARTTLDGFRFILNGVTDALPFVSKVKTGRALLDAGEELSKAGASFTTILKPAETTSGKAPSDFAGLLLLAHKELPTALDHVGRAVVALRNVREQDLPENLRPEFTKIHDALPSLTNGLQTIQQASDVLFTLAGGERTERYLVLFQDNLELRPTGGFLGSFALIDVAAGKVTKLEVPGGGTYDLNGQLRTKVASPEPLHLVNPQWQIQDANWWPDFPTSAKKVMWFYEQSGGPTVDGVISVTPNLIIDLLQKTGPIDMTEKYGVSITADNMIQQTMLAKQDTPDRPKQIIADLVPHVLDRLLTTPSIDQLSVLAVFEKAVQEKQLLLYFPDQDREAQILSLGWGGALQSAKRDALTVIDTNIGGGKTDGAIDEKIDHAATIAEDGSILDTVTVTRTHHGVPNDPMTGIRNVDFVRFYVPKGSTLVTADGFERIDPKRFLGAGPGVAIDPEIEKIEGRPIVDELSNTRISNEFGYTVFANWMGVGPGESTRASITYRLPFRLKLQGSLFSQANDEYSLLLQKQAGTTGRFVTSNIHFPEHLKLTWATPNGDTLTTSKGLVSFSSPLDTDQLLGFVLSSK